MAPGSLRETSAVVVCHGSRSAPSPNLYPGAEKPLKAWRRLMRTKSYASPHEVKSDFPSVDFLRQNVTVFDIGGNKYRLVVSMRYDWEKVFIRHVVTHKEYDRLTRDGDL